MARKKNEPATTTPATPVKRAPCNFVGCDEPAVTTEDGAPYCHRHAREYTKARAEEYLVTIGLERKPGESQADHIKRMRAWLRQKLGGRRAVLPWLRDEPEEATPQA